MSIRITAVRLSDGETHQHISRLWWSEPSTGNSGDDTRAQLVSWIEQDHVKAYVNEGGHPVDVAVVTPTSGSKYLRTHADGAWKNNLLSLPRR